MKKIKKGDEKSENFSPLYTVLHSWIEEERTGKHERIKNSTK